MKKIIGLGFVVASPFIASAAGTIGGIITLLITWVGWIVPALITVAIGFFIWGVVQFMSASDEEAKKLGRTRIINGLIGLFVIVAFWGIIAVVQNTFGIQSNGGVGADAIIKGNY